MAGRAYGLLVRDDKIHIPKDLREGAAIVEALPGLVVSAGLTDTQVAELASALRADGQPRVRVLEGAGQVAGRRGRVVAVGNPASRCRMHPGSARWRW